MRHMTDNILDIDIILELVRRRIVTVVDTDSLMAKLSSADAE